MALNRRVEKKLNLITTMITKNAQWLHITIFRGRKGGGMLKKFNVITLKNRRGREFFVYEVKKTQEDLNC